ncbi:MAG: gfo/Idh/MocA family oxidoreductase, partial [Clostridia bacterium]|nr:gfo/Idh/MocA family oxidoreductase [Clostridia bacterium]
GPIAKWLNINRGNRMLSLVAMSSKAVGINDWIRKNKGSDFENADALFAEGDIVTTLIKCAHGETITLVHDTTLPRPYSRANVLQGTNAIWSEDKHSVLIDGEAKSNGWDHEWTNLDELYERFEHPLWKWFRERKIEAGHGGMDYLSMRAFVDSVKYGTEPPIDVYDAAAWMVITVLSEDSVAMGSMPVAIPDFTNGKWTRRKEPVETRFSLDYIPTELIENYDGE